MPLTIAAPTPTSPLHFNSLRERRLRRGARRDRGRQLTIGLVNNMPDAAFAATQRQFSTLLEDGAGEHDLALTLWTLESVARGKDARRDIAANYYRAASGLRNVLPDAIIVTGAEPLASELEHEPYWGELTGLVDWARTSVVSMLASCLAAHIVTQHQDGVRRRRMSKKISGVFATQLVGQHPLTDGMPLVAGVPHSRWNDLDESELVANDYLVLRRSPEVGIDAFIKDSEHLQVFLQGHLEYDADTLAREYRRDVMRSLRGQSSPPPPPAHYFPADVVEILREYLIRAADDPAGIAFPSQALERPEATWRESSAILFRNWLSLVAARKLAASPASFARARWGG